MKKINFKSLFGSQKFRHGSFAILLTVAVVVVAVLVNVAVSAMESNWNLSVDFTKNRLYTISAQTKKVVSGLDQPIKMYALVRQGAEATSSYAMLVTETLENYRKLAPDYITVEMVDPTQNPTFARQFVSDNESLSDNSVIITNEDGSKYRVVDQYDMFEYAYNPQTYEQYVKAFIGEQKLTNAIVFVTADSVANAYFLTGHKEVQLSDFSYVTEYLEGNNLQVSSISATELNKLAKGDVLIVSAPQTDLGEEERVAIKTFLENDGSMLYMTNAGDPELPNFESLLGLYNVSFNHDLVIEGDATSYYMDPTIVVPTIGSHSSVASLVENQQAVALPYATSFGLPQVDNVQYDVQTILSSSSKAYGKTDLSSTNMEKEDGDSTGPHNLGLIIRKVDQDGNDAGTKIALLGNAMYVTDRNFAALAPSNIDLFLGAMKWLQGESDTVSIVGKSLMGNSLRFTSAAQIYTLAGISVIVLPLIVLCAGLVVWLKRRHL